MQAKKTEDFKVGICSVRRILIDKERSMAFESGEAVDVNKEELETLKTLGWGVEVNDDSDSTNTKQTAKNRDTEAG